jgi:predicted glutamate--cysteine ligase
MELRISDLVVDPIALLAITALIEARLLQAIANPTIDPLQMSALSSDDLITITDDNELTAGKLSLDATLRHWQDGRPILARDWVEQLYQEVWDTAKKQGFSCFLLPVKKILREGNEAQRWLKLHEQGMTVRQVMQQAIRETIVMEQALERELCGSLVA